MTAPDALDAVLAVLDGTRFMWSTEDDLQRGLDSALRGAGLPVEREVRLAPRDRIDLLVGRVGIEVKVKGDWRAVGRQVERYCQSDRLDVVVLVTCRADHTHVPRTSNAKPIRVHLVGSTL